MSQNAGKDWHAYNAAQIHEKTLFILLLRLGRPAIALRDTLFAMVLKVYNKTTARQCIADIEGARRQNLISKVPMPSTILKYLEMKSTTRLLRQLIIESSLPLCEIETVFANDSTGLSTSQFVRWVDHRYGKSEVREKRSWIKLHVMCGVLTNIITAVEISGPSAGDSPYFKALLQTTLRHFRVKEVSCDKAYSALKNLLLAWQNKCLPFIPFKANAKSQHRSRNHLWTRLYHFYSMNADWFEEHYHKRSNVESTFSMIKRRFDPHVRCRTKTAQINEALCKIICHNICVIIHSIYERGVEPEFWKNQEPPEDNAA